MITYPSYDTVNLWLPNEQAGAFNPLEVSKRLGKVNNGFNQHTGQSYHSGYAGNYKVFISDNGISLKGSLARYYCGNPDRSLTHLDSLYAIEKLSDELLLPINKATVKRIDLACNIVTNYKPEAYYPFLGNSRHFYRQPVFEESLYYKQKSKQKELILYDKVAELKANKQSIPKEWNGKNMLRIELKFLKELNNQFNRPEILASTLKEGAFFVDMVNRWLIEFEAIEKLNILNINYQEMKTPKDFKDHLLLMQINQLGQLKTFEMIEQMRLMGAMDRPESYSRLKSDIKQLCSNPKHTTELELITELNEKVNAVKLIL